MPSHAFYRTPLGYLKIGYEGDFVVSAKLVEAPDSPHIPSSLSERAAAQFLEYLGGIRRSFDFPMFFSGTAFQLRVWNALLEIPYAQTRTYGEIAAAIGSPVAARAVGMACSRNPIWIAVPCHRVVGKGQLLTGYAGGLDLKQRLLELEQTHI